MTEASPTLEEIVKVDVDSIAASMDDLMALRLISPQTFDDVERWLSTLPNQVDGLKGPATEDGKTYEEFYVFGMARPTDLAAVEASLARQMKGKLGSYLKDRGDNTIHWRKRLEWDTVSGEAVVRYDANGPDVEFSTNRKCVKDKNWLFITGYARLYCDSGKTAVH